MSILQGYAECFKEHSDYWEVSDIRVFSARPGDLEREYLGFNISLVPKESFADRVLFAICFEEE
ncbi:hypothetical protein HQ29_02530 [Porphyromonas canoris]|uniref:Uncharacterized protein n=1 Tax=Porphyromonas canoris TaxID=36875 RepID=A0ABR4XLL8_9PORP|nr:MULTISPECIES: hypothetical protein [Porphyromonas]KGL53463.1 hypothetical protein HQ29_02530 [Porphyromonas canoris]KGN92843.1 hypothetical protein HQ43_02900 [Porphyromonas canoris]KGN96330.1 hypothetical protein HQ39_01985 [Porphyromonas sp. COT-108 OH2963]